MNGINRKYKSVTVESRTLLIHRPGKMRVKLQLLGRGLKCVKIQVLCQRTIKAILSQHADLLSSHMRNAVVLVVQIIRKKQQQKNS